MAQVKCITLEVNGVIYKKIAPFKQAPEVDLKDMELLLTTDNLNELIETLISVRDERNSED